MINLEHVVLASPEQMEFVIEGMRNPMNSWEKSDSETWIDAFNNGGYSMPTTTAVDKNIEMFKLGINDHSLMQKLSDAGTEHRKYMRMIPVYVRITAPLYWWKEFDTYKVGTVANSCSTMHKIQEKEFTLEDFSCEHLTSWSLAKFRSVLEFLNIYRNTYLYGGEDLLEDGTTVEYKPKDKHIWWQMIQLLPSSYNQTRNVMLNYEVLANIYRQRKNHKLDEWREFCKWIESLPYSELITSEVKESIPETTSDIRQAFGILKSAGIKLTKEQLEELRKNGIFCYPVSDPKEKQGEESTDQADSFL